MQRLRATVKTRRNSSVPTPAFCHGPSTEKATSAISRGTMRTRTNSPTPRNSPSTKAPTTTAAVQFSFAQYSSIALSVTPPQKRSWRSLGSRRFRWPASKPASAADNLRYAGKSELEADILSAATATPAGWASLISVVMEDLPFNRPPAGTKKQKRLPPVTPSCEHRLIMGAIYCDAI